MSYQVIALKYRPQRFADVVGQEHVTRTLANAIAQNRIAHAYLFCGPRGTGKTTIARIFAKCLNCTGGPKVDFDDADPRCREIAEGRSLDVIEIDGASNRGIDEIRDLRETVKYAPASSKFKIYIIDEVHMLTKEAFNALLKTLEEPPAHVKFMFATTEPEKVIPTILSRCQRFDLRRIPGALIVKHLAHIARLENVRIGDAALHAIARGADGGMRDAESTLDQLISFCGETIEESDVLSMFGLAAQGEILALAGNILQGETEAAFVRFDALARGGRDLSRLLTDLLAHFRNLLIFQVSRGDTRILELSESEMESLASQAALAGSDSVGRVLDVLSDCESRLRDAVSKRILIEVGLLRAIEARSAVSLDSVLQQLQQLRDDGGHPGSAPPRGPAPAAATPRKSATTTAPQAGAGAVPQTLLETPPPEPAPAGEAASLADLWQQVVEAVGRASPFTRSYLLEAHPVSFDKGVFTIGFDPQFADHLELVDNSKSRSIVQTKLRELGCGEVQVKFIKADAPVGHLRPSAMATTPEPAEAPEPAAAAPSKPDARTKPKPAPVTLSKEDFKNDPLIRQALEIFKGQIVEVRA